MVVVRIAFMHMYYAYCIISITSKTYEIQIDIHTHIHTKLEHTRKPGKGVEMLHTNIYRPI